MYLEERNGTELIFKGTKSGTGTFIFLEQSVMSYSMVVQGRAGRVEQNYSSGRKVLYPYVAIFLVNKRLRFCISYNPVWNFTILCRLL